MVPIDRSCTTLPWSTIVTVSIALSGTIFELFDVQNIVTLKSRLGSLKVIAKMAPLDCIPVPICLPLNYGRISYRFRNKARYWSKNAIFSYLLVFNLHSLLEPLWIFAQNFNTNCPNLWAIRWCKNIAERFKSLPMVQQRYRRQTDRRQTDGWLMP